MPNLQEDINRLLVRADNCLKVFTIAKFVVFWTKTGGDLRLHAAHTIKGQLLPLVDKQKNQGVWMHAFDAQMVPIGRQL